jgi:uncharacterized membrane protein
MTSLVAAAVAFAALHLLVSGTRVRDALVARLGERAYLGAFSLASFAFLGWLIFAYIRARAPQLTPLDEVRWIAWIFVFAAFTLIVLGLMTPAPTAVGRERLLDQDDAVRGVHRITRHPFLWGVALWAAVHLVFNPGAAHELFFGTFLVVALVGTASIDAKRARRFGDRWVRYAAVTSNVPFFAILQGRNRWPGAEIGWIKVAVAAAAFALFLVMHARFFGVPAL